MAEALCSPAEVVQVQLEAYNRHDLEGFMACYSPDARIFRMPSSEPVLLGHPAIAAHYAAHRFNLPGLRAEIVNRIVLGNKVIDHERVWGMPDSPTEVAAVYQVDEGRITQVWFFQP